MGSIAPHSAWMVGPSERAIKIERGLNIRGNVSAIAKKGRGQIIGVVQGMTARCFVPRPVQPETVKNQPLRRQNKRRVARLPINAKTDQSLSGSIELA